MCQRCRDEAAAAATGKPAKEPNGSGNAQ